MPVIDLHSFRFGHLEGEVHGCGRVVSVYDHFELMPGSQGDHWAAELEGEANFRKSTAFSFKCDDRVSARDHDRVARLAYPGCNRDFDVRISLTAIIAG